MEGLRSPVRMLLEGLEGIVLLVLAVATWPVSRLILTNLGASPEECAHAWPGDRLVPGVDRCATRAVTVRAPAASVWPWILQFGLGRGGFHSYELLERLGGIDVRNVERVLPDLQSLAIGDELVLHPKAPALHVVLLEPNVHLCTRSWKDDPDLANRDPELAGSFSLYIAASSAGSCRLLVRTCNWERRRRTLGARLVALFLEAPLDLVMEQRMLRTIRRLAERGTADQPSEVVQG